MNRAFLKERAKTAFKNNYWMCVLVAFIAGIVSGGSGGSAGGFSGNSMNGSSGSGFYGGYDIDPSIIYGILIAVLIACVIGALISIFAFNPLLVGVKRFFAVNSLTKAEIGEVTCAFKNGHYGNVVKTMFLKDLFIFLWSLLFIIPGIIKAYEYYLVDYILSENPDMEWRDVLDRSKQLMDGNKFDTFVLELSFIGWVLLSVLTCGILSIFYVNPYMYQTYAELYHSLRGNGYNLGPGTTVNGPVNFGGGYTQNQQGFAGPQGYYDPSQQAGMNQGYYDPSQQAGAGQGYYDPSQQAGAGQGYYDPSQQAGAGQGYYDPNQQQGYNPNQGGYDPNNPYG